MTQSRCCRDCSIQLTLGENWTEGQQKSRSYLCRTCVSARGKRHYQIHADRAYELRRTRMKDPAKAAQASQLKSAYYAANKEKWTQYRKNQRVKERSDAWFRASRLLTWVRARAGRNGWEFDLTQEWVVEKLRAGHCEASGMPFSLADHDSFAIHPWAPSIDRIDSRSGYTQTNCRMVVWAYNVAKSEWGDAEVLKLARAILSRSSEG